MARIRPKDDTSKRASQGPSWTTPKGPAKTRFRGYRLDKDPVRRPTLRYHVGDMLVSDHTRGLQDGAGIVRTLTLDGRPPEGLSLRLAHGPVGDTKLTVTVKGATAIVTEENGMRSTRVPIAAGTKTLEVTYRW